MCISDKAYALYDGGWRSTGKEEMLDVYDGLTEEEAESICDELAELERRMEMENKHLGTFVEWENERWIVDNTDENFKDEEEETSLFLLPEKYANKDEYDKLMRFGDPDSVGFWTRKRGKNMPYLKKQFNWFEDICYGLPEEPDGALWTTGDEILCRTEEAANTIANLIESMYKAQGEDVLTITGYYDPEEDERNGETDRYTGWWYVYI